MDLVMEDIIIEPPHHWESPSLPTKDTAAELQYSRPKEENPLQGAMTAPAKAMTVSQARRFAALFLLTGIFAFVGAVYCWGDGWVWDNVGSSHFGLYLGDICLTAPLSFIASYGYYRRKKWGGAAGILLAGIYLYGSAVVYADIFQWGLSFPLKLFLPPLFGIGLSIAAIKWTFRNMGYFA